MTIDYYLPVQTRGYRLAQRPQRLQQQQSRQTPPTADSYSTVWCMIEICTGSRRASLLQPPTCRRPPQSRVQRHSAHLSPVIRPSQTRTPAAAAAILWCLASLRSRWPVCARSYRTLVTSSVSPGSFGHCLRVNISTRTKTLSKQRLVNATFYSVQQRSSVLRRKEWRKREK